MEPKDTNYMLQEQFIRVAIAFSLGALFTLGGVRGGCWSTDAGKQEASDFITGKKEPKAKP